MTFEIERKWLISAGRVPYDLTRAEKQTMEQAYVSFDPTIRIRRINDGERHVLTVKARSGNGSALVRREEEFDISAESYAFLMRKHEGCVLTKTRYKVRNADGYTEEIDIFEGDLAGLAYLEIEFPSVEKAAAYPSPSWVDKEVTEDPAFTNAALARFGRPPVSGASNRR